MGRIKTRFIKAITNDLYEKHGDEFTADFEKNKTVVTSKITKTSKKLRNTIAGYATRLKKAEQ